MSSLANLDVDPQARVANRDGEEPQASCSIAFHEDKGNVAPLTDRTGRVGHATFLFWDLAETDRCAVNLLDAVQPSFGWYHPMKTWLQHAVPLDTASPVCALAI
jgi:hypothetical protein